MANKSLVGLDTNLVSDVMSHYNLTTSLGYSFTCINLFHPSLKRDHIEGRTKDRSFPPTRSDFVLQNGDQNISHALVGKLSPWIDPDSEIDYIRKNSEKALLEELTWASHLSLPAVSFRLRRRNNPNLARILLDFFVKDYVGLKIWIIVPMVVPSDHESGDSEKEVDSWDEPGDQSESEDTWHWWSQLSTLCSDYSETLGLVLEMDADLPSNRRIVRWLSEPVVAFQILTSVFCTNAKDYPVLSKPHQTTLKRFFKLNAQVVISGACRHPRGYVTYQQYIAWLYKSKASPDLYEQQSKGMEDCLQEPLQPLQDNLCSVTYSIFEMDPYKYKAYEQAVYKALLSRSNPVVPNDVTMGNSDETNINHCTVSPIVIMVLGAGRGPLVNASLNAAGRAGVAVRVYVVEKNPNALITLKNRMVTDWRNKDVHLLPGDMRESSPPEQADIFVSELLGSFGDNELSPECLDGAQRFLKPDGISIPANYTSYLAPLQSIKIYKHVTQQKDRNKADYVPFETPYVVHLHNCQTLALPQPAFYFEHPKKDPLDDNSRYVSLTFLVEQDAVLHGFAGYFDSVLYGDINMSIHPLRHSPDMFSWFPLVFPLDRPVELRSGQRVTVRMWRVVGPKSVWYEWALTEPVTTRIHNPAGRSYTIGL